MESVVQTNTGKIRGRSEGGAIAFKGVPYGRARRFMPPEPPEAWSGVRDAFAFGPRAYQAEDASGLPPEVMELIGLRESLPMSEDCLTLNVWTPAAGDGGKRPVMLWLHGGAFIQGSSSTPWYDGTNLAAKRDLVVVSINHRLGALGYMFLEDLCGPEFAAAGHGGMLDIIAALNWVRDNIAAFGGDPGNVTLFGESGGGAKISVLMAMPAAQGLFHKAIIQSGPAVQVANRAEANETARQMLAELGLEAGQGAELQRLTPERIMQAQGAVLRKISALSFARRRRIGFNPSVDGNYLPGGPFEPAAPSISAHIPLMIGTNKDEMTILLGTAPWIDSLDEAGLRERVAAVVGGPGERGTEVLEHYRRVRPGDSRRDLLLAIATDCGIRIPSLVTAERKAAQQAAPAFVYLFTWETGLMDGRFKSPHTLEIPFVFDMAARSRLTANSPAKIGELMSTTWAAFARNGNPDNDLIPHWPAYSAQARATMLLNVESRVENDPYGEERRVWEQY